MHPPSRQLDDITEPGSDKLGNVLDRVLGPVDHVLGRVHAVHEGVANDSAVSTGGRGGGGGRGRERRADVLRVRVGETALGEARARVSGPRKAPMITARRFDRQCERFLPAKAPLPATLREFEMWSQLTCTHSRTASARRAGSHTL